MSISLVCLAYVGIHAYIGHSHGAVICDANISRTNIAMYDTLRMNVGQSTCNLVYYIQTIHAWAEKRILEEVPVAIPWSHDSGGNRSSRGHGSRPSEGYVFIFVADSQPTFLEDVHHLIDFFIALVVAQDSECFGYDWLRWGMVDKGNVRFVPIGAACVLLEATRFDDQYAGGLADRNLNSVSPDLRL